MWIFTNFFPSLYFYCCGLCTGLYHKLLTGLATSLKNLPSVSSCSHLHSELNEPFPSAFQGLLLLSLQLIFLDTALLSSHTEQLTVAWTVHMFSPPLGFSSKAAYFAWNTLFSPRAHFCSCFQVGLECCPSGWHFHHCLPGWDPPDMLSQPWGRCQLRPCCPVLWKLICVSLFPTKLQLFEEKAWVFFQSISWLGVWHKVDL